MGCIIASIDGDYATAVVVPLLVPLIAASVVVLGWARENRSKRRDERRELFTAALDVVNEYQELPYRIRRRSTESPLRREDIVARAGDIQIRIDKFATRLALENTTVGAAYNEMVATVRAESGEHMKTAWAEPRLESDAEMTLGMAYPRDQGTVARARCIGVMQAELGVRSFESSDLR